MENPVYFGVMLMIIGMTTVFTILAFVVIGGRLTILATNRFAPAQQKVKSLQDPLSDDTNLSTIAAITAAVKHATGGKGHITEIKKINH